MTSSMTKGISKLEVYCFHNNLYGYVWKYDTSHPSNVAPPNSLLNIKSIVKQRKRVIIYGDAEMARRELQYDNYEPKNNQERVVSFGMDGLDCLDYIKKMSKSVVWLNPIFQKERTNRSRTSTSLSIIQEEIPMYDLTVGGIEDAVKFLMKKK
ncbi:MAG: hypothetical protein LBG52_01095 [Candidatus Peribacteria bacterium]|nr:hypothetical protein [Candidatus Peribacteria bacterium]